MADGIVIFAAKAVGLELSTFVVERGDPVRRIVAGTDADASLLELAARHHVPAEVFSADAAARLSSARERYAWLLNFWSPHILPPEVLALAERRLNVHPSLLPHCRGNDNAAWTLRRGLPAGVSLVEMTRGVDAGPVYAQQALTYDFPITGRRLHEDLQRRLIDLFKARWPAIVEGGVAPAPQAGVATTFRRRDTEADRVLDADASMTLGEFVTWALAHDFSPGTTAEMACDGRRYKVRLHIEEAQRDE
jgi:folate-dependent phosphoribosylglycinamide formyltransferase PurN